MTETPSTLRTRAHRQRRRLGTRRVQIDVDKHAIEALIGLGYLPEAQQKDVKAIQQAVENYVADAPFTVVS